MKELPKLHRDILDLETENMVPILRKVGIKHDPAKLIEGLSKPQEIITIYNDGLLIGLVRYTVDKNYEARIWSIQLKNPNKNKATLLPLLRKAYRSIKENNIKTLVSTVQKSNRPSIEFHERIGFKVLNDFENAIRYSASLDDVERHLRL